VNSIVIRQLSCLYGLAKAVGALTALNISARRMLRLPGLVAARARGAVAPRIFVRPMDSDLFVAAEVFGRLAYRLRPDTMARLNDLAHSWRNAGDVPVIIDGGANVGYASLYFAACFPDALVVAIEPDPASFALLCRNVAQFQNIPTFVLSTGRYGVTRGASPSNTKHQAHGPLAQLMAGICPLGDSKHSWPKFPRQGFLFSNSTSRVPSVRYVRHHPKWCVLHCVMIEPHDFYVPAQRVSRPFTKRLPAKRSIR
jgi:hypothetical protein